MNSSSSPHFSPDSTQSLKTVTVRHFLPFQVPLFLLIPTPIQQYGQQGYKRCRQDQFGPGRNEDHQSKLAYWDNNLITTPIGYCPIGRMLNENVQGAQGRISKKKKVKTSKAKSKLRNSTNSTNSTISTSSVPPTTDGNANCTLSTSDLRFKLSGCSSLHGNNTSTVEKSPGSPKSLPPRSTYPDTNTITEDMEGLFEDAASYSDWI